MKKVLTIGVVAALLFAAFACSKENYVDEPNYNDAQSTTELKVPEDFDWKTVRDVQVTINPENAGVLVVQDSKGAIFQKAFVGAGASYEAEINIPTALKELYIYFNGKSETLKISGSKVNSTLK